MPVEVMRPSQKQDDPLDKILKATQIARDIYGIRIDSQKIENEKAQKELAMQEKKRLLEEQKRKDSGILNQGEVLSGQKDYAYTPFIEGYQPKKNETIVQVQGNDGALSKYVRAIRKDEGSDAAMKALKLQETQLDINKKKNEEAFNTLSKPDQNAIEDASKKASGMFSVKQGLDEVLKTLDDPKVSDKQKLAAAQGSLKLLNSAALAAPDVVGAEEAQRVGAFINPSLWNNVISFGQTNQPALTPDVKSYTDQLRIISQQMGNKADATKAQIEGVLGSGTFKFGGAKTQQQMAGQSTGGQQITVNGTPVKTEEIAAHARKILEQRAKNARR